MKILLALKAVFLLSGAAFLFSACGGKTENSDPDTNNAIEIVSTPTPDSPSPAPKFPNLQAELLDNRDKTTAAPLGSFDFKNYTYPLPRGWQDADGKEAALENGLRRGGEKTIGLSYVTTKYFDVTGDSQDEAFVILKILTAGSAIPQSVYVFTWKDDKPALIWNFRTGDRTDGGLKDLRTENGELVVELYGRDRYILGDSETMKITGDEEQLCCPDSYTQTFYKWNGSAFRVDGKRKTYSLTDKSAAPQENLGDAINEKEKKGK